MTATSSTYWLAPDVKFDALTIGPRDHFFASDQCPWDENNRDVLALESAFMGRMPTEKDALSLGFIPHGTRRFEAFDKTFAWNWQQGAKLQWLPQGGRKVIYNTRANNRFISVIRDLESNKARTLPLPVYAVSPKGDYALSLNFARLNHQCPDYGYQGVMDKNINDLCPVTDGIYRLDLKSGAWKMILSLQQAADLKRVPSMEGAVHLFNHIQINSDGSRCAVLHSWRLSSESVQIWRGRLITFNSDGSEPFILNDYEALSPYHWVNKNQIIARADDPQIRQHYFLFDDRSQCKQVIGEDTLTDGNMVPSPNRNWIIGDASLDKNGFSTLFLWKWPDGPRLDIARFYSPPDFIGPLRCGLHPRWNRDGTKVCIDSTHAGTRQIYVLDVSQITKE